jgi:hypothetical protein
MCGNDSNNSEFDLEEMKEETEFGNSCNHLIQNDLSSRLLSKNVLYGCSDIKGET